MGGFAGIAAAMAFATEFQGEGTAHAHGFVALANIYQHNTVHDIAAMLESNSKEMIAADMTEPIKSFCAHVQR